MAELAVISAIASLAAAGTTAVGSIVAGNAAKKQGDLERQAAEFEAKQTEIHAQEEFGAHQQEMLQLRRQKKLALSNLTANAAASGFSATDPTSLAVADEIEKYGTLQEQMALYGGTARSRELELAAAGKRFSGAASQGLGYARQTAGYLGAGGTILGGIGSFAEKYDRRNRAPTTMGRYG